MADLFKLLRNAVEYQYIIGNPRPLADLIENSPSLEDRRLKEFIVKIVLGKIVPKKMNKGLSRRVQRLLQDAREWTLQRQIGFSEFPEHPSLKKAFTLDELYLHLAHLHRYKVASVKRTLDRHKNLWHVPAPKRK